MGIQGLLPLLKSILNPFHIKELEGCFVAVDTYSWLHKGAISCCTELCKGQSTSKHIDYCMHRVNMLRHYGVKPILVFDGGPLPMKSEQEIKRARSRKENLSRAMAHEANGNRSAAYECFQKAVDISPSVAYDLIQVLKKENVSYVVAPYEADAQMTFLALNNHVDAVITEDSDLIAFGCPRIIYKMDKFGQGVEFKNALLQYNKDINLAGFTQTMLLEMCIFSGCDYLQSLPGMGLKKAHALMKKFRSHQNVIKHLKYNNIEFTPLYEESFKKAVLTFKHQRVYDPVSEDIVHLSEPVDLTDEDLDFLGPPLPQHVAKGIARGNLDPFTKMLIEREPKDIEKLVRGTYQLNNFKSDGDRKKLDLPAQKNLLTNYFCFASVEAKRKFRAPRITSNRPNENDEISHHSVNVHLEKRVAKTDDLNLGIGIGIKPLSIPGNSVCKPCISLQKDLELDQETALGDKNITVMSTYFLTKSRDGNEMKNRVDEGKNEDDELGDKICRKEEKKVVIKSPYFLHKNTENADCEEEKSKGQNSIETSQSDVDASVSLSLSETLKPRVTNSCFKQIFVGENNNVPESEDFVIRDEVAVERFDYDVLLEGNAMKKRKTGEADISIDTSKENKWSTDLSGSSTLIIEQHRKYEEEKMACNISHLGRYSDIAGKSMEKFVSVISSFRYGSSGSRASGLRAPLKDIKNDSCIERSTLDVDLTKFAYAPFKRIDSHETP